MSEAIKIALDAAIEISDLHEFGGLRRLCEKALETMQASEPYPAAIKTWPKRIWLQHGLDETRMPKYIEVCDGEEQVTWCQDHIEEFDIPYIRADLAAPVQAKQQEVVAWANNDGVQLRRTLNHVMSSEHGDWFPLCRCDVGVKSL